MKEPGANGGESNRLATIEAVANLGSWEWDMATDHVTWSDQLFRIYGLEPQGLHLNLASFLDRLAPEDRSATMSALETAIETGEPFDFSERIVRADGLLRTLRSRGDVIRDAAGKPVRLVGICQDITELKAAEETLEEAHIVSTLHQIGEALVVELDLQKIVQSVTDAATRLTHAQFGAFFYNLINENGESYTLYTLSGVDRSAFDKFPMPRNTPVFEPTFRGTGVVRSADITKDPRYGQMAPHHGMPKGHLPVRSYLAVPVLSRNGDTLGGLFFGHSTPGIFGETQERLAVGIAAWAAVAMDNSRLYEAERRARADAERANRAKSDFLATMSHELRTPLNAMLGYSDLLLAGIPEPVPDSAAQKVERISFSARHLLELIEEILTFSRLEAGEEKLEIEPVKLSALAEEVVALTEPLALSKGIAFKTELPDAQVMLRTDVRKLRQILVNLLGNAVKFTSQGHVTLCAAEIGDRVRFHVRDTGIGIAPEHQDNIFAPFWQVRSGTTRTAGGTGLGLSVARHLAVLLGGDINVESEPGRGTTFTVEVPAVTTPLAERSQETE